MAVYKIFPEKDASIYSGYPKMNTGRDPILEISNLNNDDLGIDTGVTRTLIKFSDSEINNVLDNVAGNPCLLYTSPSPRDRTRSRMPSSA